jgi:hypothetical protein
VLLVDQRDRQHAGTLFDAFEQTRDIADAIGRARRPAALTFKGPRVRPLAFRVVADQPMRHVPFEQNVARDACQRERERNGREQAHAKCER